MGKQASTPAAPDPARLAQLQAVEARRTQAENLAASRTSTNNALGSTSWANNPYTDSRGYQLDYWTNTQTLSPESQGIYDTSTQKLREAVDGMSTDPSNYSQSVADAVQRRMTRYLDPQQAQARSAMQSNLADRGFQVGNEAYNNEMTRLDDSQQMAQADVADRAQITGAGQGLNELTMQQQIARTLSDVRNQQVAGVSSMPTTTSAPMNQPYDIAGATMDQWSDQVDAANASNSSMNGLLGTGLTAAATYFGGPFGGMAAGSLLPRSGSGAGRRSDRAGFYDNVG